MPIADPPPRTGNYGPEIPSGSLSPFVTDHFDVIAPGATVFALSAAPLDPANTLFFVDGVLYEYGGDYTVAGSTLTWTNALFLLGPPDHAIAYYERT